MFCFKNGARQKQLTLKALRKGEVKNLFPSFFLKKPPGGLLLLCQLNKPLVQPWGLKRRNPMFCFNMFPIISSHCHPSEISLSVCLSYFDVFKLLTPYSKFWAACFNICFASCPWSGREMWTGGRVLPIQTPSVANWITWRVERMKAGIGS